jgi:thioredoxin reductase (NADPH)
MREPNSNQFTASAQVIIVGAGPIGLELAATLKRAKIDYLHFDARQIGYTISWWPRNTRFFSTTERIEIAGIPAPSTTQGRLTGEEYLAYLRSIIEQLDLQIHTYEPVTDIQRLESGFQVKTNPLSGERRYRCQNVVLATGDMHAPNKLGIPGEDLPHVSHYFRDPHDYFRKRLLVVGGRNSAVEAALRCWRAGSQVAISYRKAEFDSKIVKHFLLPDLLAQIEQGTIAFLPQTIPVEVTPEHTILECLEEGHPNGEFIVQPMDFVLLATGFVADMSLFQRAGVNLLGDECAPEYNPENMETNVPGLYVAGTAVAGSQKRYKLFIENSHVHVAKIMASLTGQWPDKIGTIPARQYDLPTEEIQAN